MSIHYTLRGMQQEQPSEHEGTLTDEQLAGVKIQQGPTIINLAIRDLNAQGIRTQWESCTLEDMATHQVEEYLWHKKRWTNRANIHSRRV